MKIVDMLLDNRAIPSERLHGSQLQFPILHSRHFSGFTVMDISDVWMMSQPDRWNHWQDYSELRLMPPLDKLLMVGKEPGFEFAVRISCQAMHSNTGETARFFMAHPYWMPIGETHPELGWSWLVRLDEHGFPVSIHSAMVEVEKEWQGEHHSGSFPPSEIGYCIGAFDDAFERTSFVLALLNCKNVRTVEQPCSPKLAKRYLERHGHDRPRYYVLDIEPMKQIIRKESSGEPVTLSKALHICRGHFKNFDDKPLFGKLKGTYWWQPHVRGTAEAGVVEKDYRIKP